MVTINGYYMFNVFAILKRILYLSFLPLDYQKQERKSPVKNVATVKWCGAFLIGLFVCCIFHKEEKDYSIPSESSNPLMVGIFDKISLSSSTWVLMITSPPSKSV